MHTKQDGGVPVLIKYWMRKGQIRQFTGAPFSGNNRISDYDPEQCCACPEHLKASWQVNSTTFVLLDFNWGHHAEAGFNFESNLSILG